MRTPTRSRRGFSLVEIITALTILAVIGGAMTKMMLSQTRGYQYDSGGRRSRTAARSAMNIMITDLRMTQDNGGVFYLDATNHRQVGVRVPLAFGVVCEVTASTMTMAITPVDSFQLATIRYGGYGVRNATTGIYTYVDGGTLTAGNVGTCHGGGVAIFADTITMGGRTGSVVQVSGAPPGGTTVGSMAMIWQRVNYVFDSSKVYPNRAGLYRIVGEATAPDTNELIAPFSWSARFSYFTNPAQPKDTATKTAPSDYNSVRGLKILFAAEAADTVPGYTGPKKSPLTTAVFFKNTRIQ
ncbi:MAG TPA: prepilin-type N-terminal cleavage/methylation domain-containing protein [Gemmatimonadaceae bacterium]|nr:prepilin-type N-terminal cleavage/methylation domain-containing protein [Gemmatimonadaceae bacterium]